MNERFPNASERNDAGIFEAMELDRYTLDQALGEPGPFTLRILMDTKSGRVLKATAREGDLMEPEAIEAVIVVQGTLARETNAQGQVTEETMVLENTTGQQALSDKGQRHLQRLLETWRETHNYYAA